VRNRFCTTGILLLSLAVSFFLPICAPAEVIVQWFETEWDDMYQRLPLVAEIGFEGIWHPSPCKSPIAGVFPNGGGGNVGYNLFDRFDVGEHPQRGTLATRYGTRGSLRNMTDNAHNCDIRIYPDIVFNHTGNGPHIESYPGMHKNDFHGWWDGAYPLGFKRAPRMSDFDPNDGDCDQNFQQELVSLFDIVTEIDNRFVDGERCGAGMAAPSRFTRHPGMLEKYPGGVELTNEHPVEFLERWIQWLGNAEDWDGVRLDAPKHVVREFFGQAEPVAWGFNHWIQENFNSRRGHSDTDEINEMYLPDIRRDDALIFGEMFIYSKSEVGYWRDWGVKMRYLDFPHLKQMQYEAFNNGNMGALASDAAFGPNEGVMFTHSHDEDNMGKKELAYAYILTHIGIPVVYFTGNNYDPADQGSRNWLKIGYESAMGEYGNGTIPNLVYIHNQFARGAEWGRWADGDLYVYERFDDMNSSGSAPDSGESLLLVGLNDGGYDRTETVACAFPDGTVLHDYTGNNPTDLTVSGGQVTLTVPGLGGQGYVCYAPRVPMADGDPIRFSSSTNMPWIIPDGRMIAGEGILRSVTRLTNDTVDINVHYSDAVGEPAVDEVNVKWGGGWDIGGAAPYDSGKDFVRGGFMNASPVSGPHWRLTVGLTNVTEGLHLVKGRVFNGGSGLPDRYQTFHETVYVDRHGPDLEIANLTNNATIDGDRTIEIINEDKTAYDMQVRINGGSWESAHEIMKGRWKYTIQGVATGTSHTVEVQAGEYDFGSPRSQINSSTLLRTFGVRDTSAMTLTMNHAEGDPIYLPFFKTSGSVGSGTVTLLWDGYILNHVDVSGGNYTNVFTGEYLSGGEALHFTGAFVNGPHFFEAVLDAGGGDVKVVSRTVFFNLYGKKDHPTDSRYAYDSDGDGLPDDIEAPGFTDGSFPGPNVQWPGDSNWDMIPQSWESWGKLNPMNHNTFYDIDWDGDDDWDNDGFPNLCEVVQGYLLHDNPAYFNIYDAGSHPDTCDTGPVAAQISWSPELPDNCDGSSVTLTYRPNEGPLTGLSPVRVGVLTNDTSAGVFGMTENGGGWQYSYGMDTNITNLAVWFEADDGGTIYDNGAGANYPVPITPCINDAPCFTMDGAFDSASYEIANNGMKILAAASGDCFYVATWSAHKGGGVGGDHFIFVTDAPGDAEAAPWAKSGIVKFEKSTKPWVAGESDTYPNGYFGLSNGGSLGRVAMGPDGGALEAEFNLLEVFGYRPKVLYIAVVVYGDVDGSQITDQCPTEWQGAEYDAFLDANVVNLDEMEFLPVCVESVRDEDLDGDFDRGAPAMQSDVGGTIRDANYDLRRFFIDELAGESSSITVTLFPNVTAPDVATDVELISNLNRRNFAVMTEDLDLVTAANPSGYSRAYPMATIDPNQFRTTLPVNRCGAYRINARYKLNGSGPWIYYTDHCLRRDLAVVVSPPKALDVVMYEVNPTTAEATEASFAGRSTFEDLYIQNIDRPDTLHSGYYTNLGVNMLWLQPIHPIGIDGRDLDPDTLQPWNPGSPYAVRDYWSVSPALGSSNTPQSALQEFKDFVSALDSERVGVMMDGTFNHSAPDCVLGQGAVDLFVWATNGNTEIRSKRPQWFAKAGSPGEHATVYQGGGNTDIAIAPDRIDFGKWTDVREFWFGSYDALVKGGSPGESSSRHYREFLSERDVFYGQDAYSAEVWEYFAHYGLYWLDQTGCPEGTPKSESYKGIDGLRCDFAQGLPSQFWEYCINRTRQRKWDFIFMAESLDGYREIDGSKRHGVGYRSSRHFDVLNENMVFYWRDQFFDYPANGCGGGFSPTPTTGPTRDALTDRREAYDGSPILLNLSGHDEVLPNHDGWRLFYAHAELAAVDGVPMMLYGQEAGAQNDAATYQCGDASSSIPDALHNFDHYELNFGKSIPNFKRYNCMTSIWQNANATLRAAYGRANRARLQSPALRSQGLYFLNDMTTAAVRDDIFAVAKFEQPGISAATQDVVFAFVNNNYWSGDGYGTNLTATYNVDVDYNGANWFGIVSGHLYNVVDLLSTSPTIELWGSDLAGSVILAAGLGVGLNQDALAGKQAQYIKLIDKTDSGPGDNDNDGLNDWQDPDDDNDGMPDVYETANNLDPLSGIGVNGWGGDKDGDTISNGAEMIAGTDPDDINDFLRITSVETNTVGAAVTWRSVSDIDYTVEHRDNLLPPDTWQPDDSLTALSSNQTLDVSLPSLTTNRFWRVQVIQ